MRAAFSFKLIVTGGMETRKGSLDRLVANPPPASFITDSEFMSYNCLSCFGCINKEGGYMKRRKKSYDLQLLNSNGN